MLINDFIKCVESLGTEFTNLDSPTEDSYIFITFKGSLAAVVNKRNRYDYYIEDALTQSDDKAIAKLRSLITEFAATPLEGRYTKLYRVKNIPMSEISLENRLTRHKSTFNGVLVLGNEYSFSIDGTMFTEQELRDIKLKDGSNFYEKYSKPNDQWGISEVKR